MTEKTFGQVDLCLDRWLHGAAPTDRIVPKYTTDWQFIPVLERHCQTLGWRLQYYYEAGGQDICIVTIVNSRNTSESVQCTIKSGTIFAPNCDLVPATICRAIVDMIGKAPVPGGHACRMSKFPHRHCGPAVSHSRQDPDGTLWVDNGEYATQVNFCPCCGHAAQVPVVQE